MLEPWEKIFISDDCRYETYKESVMIFGEILKIYDYLKMEVQIIEKNSVQKRVDIILNHLKIYEQTKYCFFWNTEFATSSLVALIKNHFEIKAVVTSIDKKSGIGNKIKFSHIKSYCIENKLKLLQPQSLQNPIFIDDLKSMEADVFVVVAYRMLPKIVWEIPRKGTINLHASILPSLRGAAPINWAIINGLKETGLTTFFINEKIDTGDIILQKKVRIDENENFGSLHQKLMIYGGVFLVSSLKLIDSNRFKLRQDTKSKNLTVQA